MFRERSLVHLLNERDDVTLVRDEVAPLKARNGEGDRDCPDRGDVLEERVQPGREIWPECDLIRSHVWRFLIEVSKNWSVSISACRSVGWRRCAFRTFRSVCSAARRRNSLIQRPPDFSCRFESSLPL